MIILGSQVNKLSILFSLGCWAL